MLEKSFRKFLAVAAVCLLTSQVMVSSHLDLKMMLKRLDQQLIAASPHYRSYRLLYAFICLVNRQRYDHIGGSL